MSDTSPILGLPYIQPAQAQKHVTHNEAIRALDTLVQLAVTDRDQTTPPATPTNGDRHIVAPGATGAWAGQDNAIAIADGGTWQFYTPQPGWSAVDTATGVAVIWNGTDWTAPAVDASALQNVATLGVNTTANTTNRLSVSSDATLLTHAGTDHRVAVNKAADTDTASLLFQTGYGGRAEMGTAGSDDFTVKVSADGASWNTGLSLDATTGTATFPSGAQVSNRVEMGGRWSCMTNNRWVTHSSTYGIQGESHSLNCGTGAEPSVEWEHLGALVPAGAKLQNMDLAIRKNSDEVTGFDLRICFQTGPWSAGWDTNGAVTRTDLATANGVTMASGLNRFTYDLGGYTPTQDGFVLLFLRPTGTITATRYLQSAINMTYLTAA